MNEEKTTEDIFERFIAERKHEILPDIDLLMEVGIRNSKWQTFTDEEKIALNDTLVQMERVNGGIRNNLQGVTSGKPAANKWEDEENKEPFQPNMESIEIVRKMVAMGRLNDIPQIVNFIKKFPGESVIGK